MQHNSRQPRQSFNKPSFNPSKKEYNVVENLQDYMFTGTNLTRYAKDMFTINNNNNNNSNSNTSNHNNSNTSNHNNSNTSNHTKNKNSYLEPGKDKNNNPNIWNQKNLRRNKCQIQ